MSQLNNDEDINDSFTSTPRCSSLYPCSICSWHGSSFVLQSKDGKSWHRSKSKATDHAWSIKLQNRGWRILWSFRSTTKPKSSQNHWTRANVQALEFATVRSSPSWLDQSTRISIRPSKTTVWDIVVNKSPKQAFNLEDTLTQEQLSILFKPTRWNGWYLLSSKPSDLSPRLRGWQISLSKL